MNEQYEQTSPSPMDQEQELSSVSGQQAQQGLPDEPEPVAVAYQIADELGETDALPRAHIVRIVKAIGPTAALAFLARAKEVEAAGGMMTLDGSRRRSIGGIYFYLVYGEGIVERTGKPLRRPFDPTRPKPASSEKNATAQPQAQQKAMGWEERLAIIDELTTQEKGTAATMKITLVGTFGTYKDQGTCVVGIMQATEKVPALPKGVPIPPTVKTKYVVYIGAKQWKSVAQAAQDKEDALIIEGYPQLDAQKSVISVFATSVTSKKLQAAKREAQRSGTGTVTP